MGYARIIVPEASSTPLTRATTRNDARSRRLSVNPHERLTLSPGRASPLNVILLSAKTLKGGGLGSGKLDGIEHVFH